MLSALDALSGVQLADGPWPALPAAGSATDDVVVALSPEDLRQPIFGFGAALTESAAVVIAASPHKSEILDDLFLPADRGGAGLSLVRICIGSSDFAMTMRTYQPDELGHFDASHESQTVIPLLREAMARNPNLSILASPWSPPAWMKSSGKLPGGTLKDECVAQYCHYLLRVLLFYRSTGLPISALTLQNEPDFGDAEYPCTYFTAEQEAKLAKALVPLLRRNGVDTLVLGHDHNYDIWERAAELIERAGDVLDGTAWHAYMGSPEVLADKRLQSSGIFHTEQTAHTHRGRDANFRGDVEWMLGNVLLGPISYGSRSASAWNLALDDGFGPVVPGGPTNCRGLVEVGKAARHERSPEFFALAHMCHATAAPAGGSCARVGSSCSRPEEVQAEAFGTSAGTCGVVLYNRTDRELTVAVQAAGRSVARYALPAHGLASVRGLRLPSEGPLRSIARPGPRVPVAMFRVPPKFALKSVGSGLFLAAHGSGDSVYQSSAGAPSDWETWFPVALPSSDRLFAMRSWHGTFVGRGAGGELRQERNWFSQLTFTFFVQDTGAVGLCSEHGAVQMPGDGTAPRLVCCCFGAAETFTVVPLE